MSYMYLGLALNHLDDFKNCTRAFERALQLEEDHLICLNYSIVLLQKGTPDEFKKGIIYYEKFKKHSANIN